MSSKVIRTLEVVAIAIGVIGGIFAIPKGISESWQTIMGGAEVTAMRTTPLSVVYEASTKQLTLRFGVLLHNEGVKAERIKDITAELRTTSQPAIAQSFSLLQMNLKEGNVPVPHNLPIEKEHYRALTCEVQSYLTEELLEVLREGGSGLEFEVLFFGEQNQYSVKFRFDITTDLLADLLNPKAKGPRTLQFIGSNL